jgi:hypothetical protein
MFSLPNLQSRTVNPCPELVDVDANGTTHTSIAGRVREPLNRMNCELVRWALLPPFSSLTEISLRRNSQLSMTVLSDSPLSATPIDPSNCAAQNVQNSNRQFGQSVDSWETAAFV